MTDQIKICNSALIKIGVNPIASLSETNKAARLCNEQYDKMRRACLREHPWNFANSRVEIATLLATPAFGFAYALALPADCIRVRKIEASCSPFKIEGRALLTDADSAKILYTSDVTDASIFDDSFAEALSARLAADLAQPLVQSMSLAKEMMGVYMGLLRNARLANAQEGTPDDIMDSDFINVRY